METQPDIGAKQGQMQQLDQSHLLPILVHPSTEFEQSRILSGCISLSGGPAAANPAISTQTAPGRGLPLELCSRKIGSESE
jgi:hypothetical protein